MSDDDHVVVPAEVAGNIATYLTYSEARYKFEKAERELKRHILASLGYEDGDPKPVPCVAVSPNDVPLVRVTVGQWRGLDTAYLKDKYPHIYAECEKVKPTLRIVECE